MEKPILLTVVLLIVTVCVFGQQNVIKEKYQIGGIWALSPIPCSRVITRTPSSDFNNFLAEVKEDAISSLKVRRSVGLAFIDNQTSAHAVWKIPCEQITEKRDYWVLVGEYFTAKSSLLNNPNLDIPALTTDDKVLLIAMMGHEIAHFVQHGDKYGYNRRESEFHSDFFAGWYLYQYLESHKELKVEFGKRSPLEPVDKLLSVHPVQCQEDKGYPLSERRQAMGLKGFEFGKSNLDKAKIEAKKLTTKVIKETPEKIKCRY